MSRSLVLDALSAGPALNAIQKATCTFVTEGTNFVYRTAKELRAKIAFGTDTLFSADLAKRQEAQLAELQRWLSAFEALKTMTCDNAGFC